MTAPRDRPTMLPMAPPSPVRFVVVALLVPAVLIGAAAWVRSEYQESEAVRVEAAQSFDRRLGQVSLLSRLKDAETAQRGYMLTGDPAFLQPYEPARQDIRYRLALAAAARDPDVPSDYVPEIRRLVALRFAELDRGLLLQRRGDEKGALALVASGEGLRIMDRLRHVIGGMIADEESRSALKQSTFLDYRGWLQQVVYATVAALIAALFACLLILWDLRRQRHAAFLAALEAAERHATILDSTIDAILILDPRGTVETANASATRMLGHLPADLEGRDIATIFDPAPGGESFASRVALVDGQLRRSFLPNQVVRHRDGHAVAVDVAVGLMNVAGGGHLVVSLRDIAERKRVERVKDELISTVSHELRTPLTSIIGSLGLLRAGTTGALPEKAARLVEIAENNSRRLIRLINDMLDIDRIESGSLAIDRATIDLRAVVDRACLGSEGLAHAKGVALHCPAPDTAAIVEGDADRLLQVVTNLLSNAIRAAPASSTVDIRLSVADGRALVAVDDRGPGVPVAFRSRIFGRFERAEPEGGGTGTGLGLAISREIVVRHDGRIWFEDRAGGGTRFAFSLPLGCGEAGRGAAPAVLVCEDDDAVAARLSALVAAEGFVQDRVRSGAEARAALAGRRYGALLVSLGLPDEGGLAFAHAVRDGEPPFDGPIVVVAAEAIGDGDEPHALDVIDWIGKPDRPERLSEALRSALARSAAPRPVVLHVDDDRDLIDVVAAAIEPHARVIAATGLDAARAVLQDVSPDLAILDLQLSRGSGLDLIPFLVGADGRAIPTIVYSAQDVPPEQARSVDAVLVKARGSIPDLKATIHRVLRDRATAA